MTGDQLKRWRDNRGLTQDQMAEYLGEGWTRQRVANVESARTTMIENIDAKLVGIDEVLARAPAPNQVKLPKRVYDYSKHKCWDLAGNLITMQHVLERAPGYCFYRLDNSTNRDLDTGHQIADMWTTTRAYPRGVCNDFQLDIVTWDVLLKINVDNARNKAAHPKLQAMMQGRRDALERAKTMAAANPGMFELDPTTLGKSIFDPPT